MVMDKQTLISRIRVILNHEFTSLSHANDTLNPDTKTDKVTGSFVYTYVYDTLHTMLQLYSSIETDIDLKNVYLDTIKEELLVSRESTISEKLQIYASTSRLCFFILFNLNYFNDALDILCDRANTHKQFILIVNATETILKLFGDKLNLDQLLLYRNVVLSHPNTGSHVHNILNIDKLHNVVSLIDSYTYNQVKKELDGVNIEINADKQKVIKFFDEFNFDTKLSLFLNELDIFLYSESEIIASALVGDFRMFMSDFIIGLGDKILEANAETLLTFKERNKNIKRTTEVGILRLYIVEKLELTTRDDEFIDAFVNILHLEGGHSFLSKKEYLRLVRNIGIEIILFLLAKYNERYSAKST